jgi:purine-binding chemotaxis protein CheW
MEAVNESPEQTEQTPYLTFAVAGEDCAVSLLKVREIIEYVPTLTAVPTMPPSILGVINVRGHVVPVIDLAVAFKLRSSPITRRTCVVIVEVALEGERSVMGVIADSVSQVLGLSPRDIEAPPAFGTRIRLDYLKGLGKVGNTFVLIVDLDRVLSFQELRAA